MKFPRTLNFIPYDIYSSFQKSTNMGIKKNYKAFSPNKEKTCVCRQKQTNISCTSWTPTDSGRAASPRLEGASWTPEPASKTYKVTSKQRQLQNSDLEMVVDGSRTTRCHFDAGVQTVAAPPFDDDLKGQERVYWPGSLLELAGEQQYPSAAFCELKQYMHINSTVALQQIQQTRWVHSEYAHFLIS